MDSITTAAAERPNGLPRLLDIAGVAEVLGVAPRHVRRLVAERRIPYVKWGHLIRFDPDEVDQWLRLARVPATSNPLLPESRTTASWGRTDRRQPEGAPRASRQ